MIGHQLQHTHFGMWSDNSSWQMRLLEVLCWNLHTSQGEASSSINCRSSITQFNPMHTHMPASFSPSVPTRLVTFTLGHRPDAYQGRLGAAQSMGPISTASPSSDTTPWDRWSNAARAKKGRLRETQSRTSSHTRVAMCYNWRYNGHLSDLD